MQIAETIISPRWILPIAPQNIILENHSIVLNQGRILDILPTESVAKHYSSKSHIQRPDHVVLPGLINCHTHTPMSLFRGLADDLPLMDWLNNHIWPAEKAIINAESIKDGCRLAIAEMLRGGTTCFNEMYFFPNETAETAIQEGMRACIGHTIMNVPTGWANNEDEYIEKAKQAHSHRPENPLISWSIAPQGPYTNSDRSLKLAKELADELGIFLQMHLHETEAELQIDLNNHGKRPLLRLYDLGLLNERFIGVHMVHLTPEEIALCADIGLNVAHNPESNLKLASGFAPVVELMNAGVNVALATDGAASNNDLDMFSEMRTAAFIAKAINKDSTVLPATTALEMATINGARAIGLEHEIGSLEVGKAADMIAVDLGVYLTQPIYNPISHLVYAANRLQVSDVWIAGKALLEKGEFTQLDTEAVVARVQQWAAKSTQFQSAASTAKTTTMA